MRYWGGIIALQGHRYVTIKAQFGDEDYILPVRVVLQAKFDADLPRGTEARKVQNFITIAIFSVIFRSPIPFCFFPPFP